MRYCYSKVAAFVIDVKGKPAEPVRNSRYAKYLVRSGQARIIVKNPLTIRMLHNAHIKEASYGKVL